MDHTACPWLIKNFVDADAEFIYVPNDKTFEKAKELNAIPYDLPGAEYTHQGDSCTFYYIMQKHKIVDPAARKIAEIVRGARYRPFPACAAGPWAISAGLSYKFKDDYEVLCIKIEIYDDFYGGLPMFRMKNTHD